MNLTFSELRTANVVRCESSFKHSINDWSPTDWACAATGEMGEACNLIKKLRRGEQVPTEEIAHEIADTVIYLDLLAARLGIDLGEAVRRKFDIVSERVGSSVRLSPPSIGLLGLPVVPAESARYSAASAPLSEAPAPIA